MSSQLARRVVSKRQFSTSRVVSHQERTILQKLFKIPLDAGAIGAVLATTWLGGQIFTEASPKKQKPQTALTTAGATKKDLVILGSGWGSASMLKSLDTSLYNVTVVSPRNYFLFTPLLPSAPTGTIEPKSIVEPIRAIAKRTPGEVTFMEADATDIDVTKSTVTVKQASTEISGVSKQDSGSSLTTDSFTKDLKYDYLVVGVGAQPTTFGIPGVAEHACFLKELPDSYQVKRKMLDCIEKAALYPKGSEERKRLLSFVVVGGGPTGVEFAGELQDYIDEDLHRWMPEIAEDVQVTLVEALPNVLNAFSKKLWSYAHQVFEETNIHLALSTAVKNVTPTTVFAQSKLADGTTKDLEIPYGMLVWATGNAPRDFTKLMFKKIAEQNTARRGLLVDENLKVNGTENVFAIGDCAFTGHPPTGQVAHQEGDYVSEYLKQKAALDDLNHELSKASNSDESSKVQTRIDSLKSQIKPFNYAHMGALSYVGAEKAVADLVWGKFSSTSTGGTFTYLIWRASYIAMCISARQKALVAFDWLKITIFGRDTSKE
ncbi:hypothetical protein CANARDRAFT_26093 [[Candida] arabinofermentans NRRL YB-2248]|uniref:NADH:ubiquinone reductase (non-electrogenic) n=1 Tax=[Candida] arabinofermentans NRRL YB-2248 TaxID=983967 RepID=A0A1E4T831_9ASCO|nr:hypothetical protein CANARDRAFT_26093 [[Candida] arabinofermentans NRRL YB-2248]